LRRPCYFAISCLGYATLRGRGYTYSRCPILRLRLFTMPCLGYTTLRCPVSRIYLIAMSYLKATPFTISCLEDILNYNSLFYNKDIFIRDILSRIRHFIISLIKIYYILLRIYYYDPLFIFIINNIIIYIKSI